jgi:HD-GYP domain-containing protein (c-di-GMP phosphodiesterase class II)
MRAIPTSYIKKDVILAENIYSKEGAVVLRNGATVNEKTVQRINALGIFTIYICDEYSTSKEIDYLVNSSVRMRGVNLMKVIYEKVRQRKSIEGDFDTINILFDDIYYELLDAKSRQLNYIDIKSVENYIYGHALNVGILSLLIGLDLGLNSRQLKSLFYGAILHDVGMMFIDEVKFVKEGTLHEVEFAEVKKHPTYGYDYIKGMLSVDAYTKNIILTHHERMSGQGYPSGIAGGSIHLYSKIVGLCDVYDAMTSDRLYKRAVPPNEAIEYMMGDGGQQFDMAIIESFCRRVNPYPEGSLVKLNTGKIALVNKVMFGMPLRPKVSIIENVGPKLIFTEVDLYEVKNLVIVGPHY